MNSLLCKVLYITCVYLVTACPGNCAQCDDTGCIKCNNEWLINKGQCGNCPFHCKKCSMASDSKTLKCDSKECYDGFGLDASRDNCIGKLLKWTDVLSNRQVFKQN